ncbi:MAG TPA: hypothetical protein VGC42_26065 [Kofleriaceae bacterium]
MSNDELIMNPMVDLHIHPAPQAYPIDVARVETISVKCPVRGRGLVIHELGRASPLFGFFAELLTRGGELELDSDAAQVAALVELGFLITEAELVDWPQFRVPLPDGAACEGSGWIVAPHVRYQADFALHPAIRWPADYDEQDGRLRCFAPGPALWVGDPAVFTSPYWLTGAQATQLAALVPGAPPPPLPAALTAALVAVGALVRASAPEIPSRFAAELAAYRRDGHAIARDFLPAAELAALRRYYTALLDGDLVQLGDRQLRARYSTYNDPIGRFVHARLAPVMAALVGAPVLPSFCYFFSYLPGAALAPHKDRAQAEFSISLQLDHHPAPDGATGWPLGFTFDDGRAASADLGLGDAVLYHGRAIRHHRAPLPADQRSSVLVFEYVPADFAGLVI